MEVKYFPRLIKYETVLEKMQTFTAHRHAETPDEIWVVEHEPVYTLGQAGKREHLLNPQHIPIVQTNRGGQVTYHGPGQIVVYPLIDLHRAKLFVRDYVNLLEESLIRTLKQFGLNEAQRKAGAPGVYVPLSDHTLAKIAALGVKVTQGRTYHGLALNVQMDLRPFEGINPCGYAGLKTVDMASMGVDTSWEEVSTVLLKELILLLENR